MQIYLQVAVVGYLLGSIPFGYLLVRIFRGQDIRQRGSGNIGATNVMRTGARGLGIATLVLDAGKGFAAVVIAERIFAQMTIHSGRLITTPEQARLVQQYLQATGQWQSEYVLAAIAAIAAILGHMYPVWLKFRGGKGVATGVGAFIALAPLAVAIVLVIFAAVVVVSRYVSLASIVATAAFPVFAWLLYRSHASPAVMAATVAAAALIILRHKDNIRRLLAGTEHRFELKHR